MKTRTHIFLTEEEDHTQDAEGGRLPESEPGTPAVHRAAGGGISDRKEGGGGVTFLALAASPVTLVAAGLDSAECEQGTEVNISGSSDGLHL